MSMLNVVPRLAVVKSLMYLMQLACVARPVRMLRVMVLSRVDDS